MEKVIEFREGLDWFNSAPLRFDKELQGKIVLLDFWTYCCINCLHVLPQLAKLEEKYQDLPVVFIGVHSAKFDNEKISSHIREAILRYDIKHPVVNDLNMEMWSHLDIHSWPSFVIIGPRGQPLFRISGERSITQLDHAIHNILSSYDKADLNLTPIPKKLEEEHYFVASSLFFPNKLAIDEDNNRLFISDSHHHRIIVTKLDGTFITQVGSGDSGFDDGNFYEATFHDPQGVEYFDNCLYVADTENHALRKIDLHEMTVSTIAGNGSQGMDYRGGKVGKEQPLNSPWDLTITPDGKFLYIAMAGSHQIWVYDFKTGQSKNFSGTGMEQNLNSENALHSAWAQPSGICFDSNKLFIADSESSSIRMIDTLTLQSDTLVGGDENPYNLFSYGNVDGSKSQAKLQHPLGLTWIPSINRIAVTDSYNHQIKLVDPYQKSVTTIAGAGFSGSADAVGVSAQFSEPAGLAATKKGMVYIADTNNHAIRILDLKTNNTTTLQLRNIPTQERMTGRLTNISQAIAFNVKTPGLQSDALVVFEIQLPDDMRLMPGSPNCWHLLIKPDSPITAEKRSGKISSMKEIFEVRFRPNETSSSLEIELLLHYCSNALYGSCHIKEMVFNISFQEGKQDHATIPLKVK